MRETQITVKTSTVYSSADLILVSLTKISFCNLRFSTEGIPDIRSDLNPSITSETRLGHIKVVQVLFRSSLPFSAFSSSLPRPFLTQLFSWSLLLYIATSPSISNTLTSSSPSSYRNGVRCRYEEACSRQDKAQSDGIHTLRPSRSGNDRLYLPHQRRRARQLYHHLQHRYRLELADIQDPQESVLQSVEVL